MDVVVKVAFFYLGAAPDVGEELAAGQGLVRMAQEKFHKGAFSFGKGEGDSAVLKKVLFWV